MKIRFLFSAFFIISFCTKSLSQELPNLKQDNSSKMYVTIVGKHQKDKVTKTELLAAKKLDLINNSDSAYHIISFQLLEVCKGFGPVILNSESDKITSDMIWAFDSLSANGGCKVYFQDILCADKKHDTIQAPNFLLYVVPEIGK